MPFGKKRDKYDRDKVIVVTLWRPPLFMDSPPADGVGSNLNSTTSAIVESSQVLPRIVLLVLIALQVDIFGSAFGVTWRVRAAYDAVAEEQTMP